MIEHTNYRKEKKRATHTYTFIRLGSLDFLIKKKKKTKLLKTKHFDLVINTQEARTLNSFENS